MEKQLREYSTIQIYEIEVKISNGTFTTVIKTDANIYEEVGRQFVERQEYIIFGDMGVKRELIDWYTIKDVKGLVGINE